MKKIGIVTYHKVRNYGSVLQSYALMRVLQKKGYDVQIVNYNAISTEEEFAKNANKVLTCCNVANPSRKAFFEEFAANGYESAVKKYCKVGVLNVLMTELGLKPIIRKITGR